MDLIDDFSQVKECVYKGEHYSVRDNGAILRHTPAGKKKRPLDECWTFGKINLQNGYLYIGNARVHRIVALAFYGEPPTKEHITDHIDTNRQNNRPENLRYLTRLENALLNPITRSKIEYYCGSIRAFLENPQILRNITFENNDKNIEWMRNVSVEEAQNCLTNLQHLSSQKSKPHSVATNKMGEWIYKPIYPQKIDAYHIKAISPNTAIQRFWNTPTEFPLCPKQAGETPLEDYFKNLKKNAIFAQNRFYSSTIVRFDRAKNKDAIFVLSIPAKARNYQLTQIVYENNFFVHINRHTIPQKERQNIKKIILKIEKNYKKFNEPRLLEPLDFSKQNNIKKLNFNEANFDTNTIPITPYDTTQYYDTEFPLCPQQCGENPIEDYFKNLKKGAIYSNGFSHSAIVIHFAISKKNNLVIMLKNFLKQQSNFIKAYAIAEVQLSHWGFEHIGVEGYTDEQETYKAWAEWVNRE